VLLVKMHYSNWRNWELLPSDLCRITVTVQRNAWGYGSNTFYDEVRLQTDGTLATSTTQHFTTGVTVNFVIGGSLGYWDTITMLVFLVASAALVRFGVFLVDAFMLSSPACCGCTHERATFREHKVDEVTLPHTVVTMNSFRLRKVPSMTAKTPTSAPAPAPGPGPPAPASALAPEASGSPRLRVVQTTVQGLRISEAPLDKYSPSPRLVRPHSTMDL
jgi:hypothetical protein